MAYSDLNVMKMFYRSLKELLLSWPDDNQENIGHFSAG